MKQKIFSALGLGGLAMLAAHPAAAHIVPGEHASFMTGLIHPLTGADHIAAMVSVGLWASMLGGRATWAVPGAFVATMMAGFGLAVGSVGLPFVEPMIAASVLVMGLMVASAARLSTASGAALVAVFALFHGYAHGTEMGAATPTNFMAGFALGTAVLQVAGLSLGAGLTRLGGGYALSGVTRVLGSGVALLGLGLSLSLV